MKVEDYLIKQPWKRRVRQQGMQYSSSVTGQKPGDTKMTLPSGTYEFFTQDKFLDELNSGSHIVYDVSYRSMRPKYKYDTEKHKNVQNGYEDVVRTAISWQEAIRGNKVSTCGGNPIWIGNEGGEENAVKVNKVKTHLNVTNFQSAIAQHMNACFGTGDGALYFYLDEDKTRIRWKCFSYEQGDNCSLTRDYENPDKKMGVRYFNYEDTVAVEFYRDEFIELYIKFKDEEDMRHFFPDAIGTITEDGFYLISKTSHGINESPFCYYREQDTPWGPVQKNIEAFEEKISDCGENEKYYAYQMLFISGGAISLPNANFGGKVLGSKTTDGDAKILEPADASNILDIGFKKTFNAICDGSKSVFIKPEDLKGQNDSGAYIANLYWPELQWANLFYSRYSPFMDKVLRVVRKLVGIIEGDMIGYQNLLISYVFEPYIPKNKLEQSTILQQGVTAGFLSVETATEESDSANPLEIERLQKEAQEKEERAQRIMAQKNPEPPKKEGEE